AAVEDHRGAEFGLSQRIAEGLRAAPAETKDTGASVRRRQALAVTHRGVEPVLHLRFRQRADGLADLVAQRCRATAVRSLAREEIGGDRDETILRQLVRD